MADIQTTFLNKSARRDNYIDFVKGLAAVNIIFIHTTFWSGESYVPELVKSLSLIVDVSMFFFLSGMGFSYRKSFSKSLNSIIKVYKKYVLFLSFYWLCLLLIGGLTGNWQGINLKNLYGNLFFANYEKTSLVVVMGSMWFMPVYFIVVIIGSFVLSTIWEKVNYDEKKFRTATRTACGIVFWGLLYSWQGGNFFYISSRTLLYLFIWMLGVAVCNERIHRFSSLIVLLMTTSILMKVIGIYFDWNISNMQRMKFPPNIIWLLYSFISIFVMLYGRAKLTDISENNPFCKIGRSSILFYFCQGIGSSFLVWVKPYIVMPWLPKLVIMFTINICGTVILVLLLKKYYMVMDCVGNYGRHCFLHSKEKK